MPKYISEVTKHFSGDKTLAARYMGVARGLLGSLVDMSGDVFQNARKVILPDGTKITVSFAGALARIAIDVRSVLSGYVRKKRCEFHEELMVGPGYLLYKIANCILSKLVPDEPYTGVQDQYVIIGEFDTGYLTSYSPLDRYRSSDPWSSFGIDYALCDNVYLCNELAVPYRNSGVGVSGTSLSVVIVRRDSLGASVTKLRVFSTIFIPGTDHAANALNTWDGKGDSTSTLYKQEKIRRVIRDTNGSIISSVDGYVIEITPQQLPYDSYFKFDRTGSKAVVYVNNILPLTSSSLIEIIILRRNSYGDDCAWTLENIFYPVDIDVFSYGIVDYVHYGNNAGKLAFVVAKATRYNCHNTLALVPDIPSPPPPYIINKTSEYDSSVEIGILYEDGYYTTLDSSTGSYSIIWSADGIGGGVYLNLYTYETYDSKQYPIYGCDLRNVSIIYGRRSSQRNETRDKVGPCIGSPYQVEVNHEQTVNTMISAYAHIQGTTYALSTESSTFYNSSTECYSSAIPPDAECGPTSGYAAGGTGYLAYQVSRVHVGYYDGWAGITGFAYDGVIKQGCSPIQAGLMGLVTKNEQE